MDYSLLDHSRNPLLHIGAERLFQDRLAPAHFVLDFGSRFSGFGFRVLDFGMRDSDRGVEVEGLWYRDGGLGIKV